MTVTSPPPPAPRVDAAPGPQALPSRRSLETLIVRVVTAVIGLHVVDDNFLQPEPGHFGLRPPSGWPRAARPAVRRGSCVPTPASVLPRRHGAAGRPVRDSGGARGLALLALGRPVRRRLHRPRHPGRGRAAAAPCRGHAVARSPSRRQPDDAATDAGRSSPSEDVALGFFIVLPVVLGYQFTHLATSYVPEAKLGTAYEEVSFKTSDGLELEGWYIPSRNGAAVISFPGRKVIAEPRAVPGPPRLRRAAVRSPR